MSTACSKLSMLGLGIALGLTWAISTLILGLIAWHWGYGMEFVKVMGSMYMGFKPTLLGSIFGGLYGFVDGFIGGILIAFFYNLYVGCCHKKEA
jgi:hypothetical protein